MRRIALGFLVALVILMVGCKSAQVGLLEVSIDTSFPIEERIYTSGSTGVEMVRMQFSATEEDMRVTSLEFQIPNGTGNIERVTLLGTGLPTDPSTLLVDERAEFNFAPGSEMVVQADKHKPTRLVTVVADITQVGTTIAGQYVNLELRSVHAIGSVSGASVSWPMLLENSCNIYFVVSQSIRMEEVEPVINRHPLGFYDTGISVPSEDQTVSMFSITASGFRDLVFNGLMVVKEGSNNPDRYVTNFSLWLGSVQIASAKSETSWVLFTFPEQIITAGASEILAVKADTRNVRSGVTSGPVYFAVVIPGLTSWSSDGTEGGFSWTYTPLGPGSAVYTTMTDSYPVYGFKSRY
ncbi:MAG: hypothetical protein Q8O97_00195 [bacterium]|nr:hypothetical protein [Candidatus Wildermuthbacteria bacterium]MDP2664380.1 hypothetical protein [bacterium]